MDKHSLPERMRAQLPHPNTLAQGLGWFSIALGVAEIVMPLTIARACGLKDSAGLIRLHGLREIACGIGILRARNAEPWLWGRVAGDVVDASTIVAETDMRDARALRRSGLALANVATVAALDVYTARNWQAPRARPGIDYPDYSDRVGMPRSPAEMRGAALTDFDMPRDMRVPELLRPWSQAKGGHAPATLSVGPLSADQEEAEQLARGDFT